MFNMTAQNMGMSQPAKKKTKRGRKASTKPGADHLSKLQQAHGAGDLHGAKLHALNFANALTKHLKAPATPDQPMSMDADDPSIGPPPAPPAAPAQPDRRAQLARLALTRRK